MSDETNRMRADAAASSETPGATLRDSVDDFIVRYWIERGESLSLDELHILVRRAVTMQLAAASSAPSDEWAKIVDRFDVELAAVTDYDSRIAQIAVIVGQLRELAAGARAVPPVRVQRDVAMTAIRTAVALDKINIGERAIDALTQAVVDAYASSAACAVPETQEPPADWKCKECGRVYLNAKTRCECFCGGGLIPVEPPAVPVQDALTTLAAELKAAKAEYQGDNFENFDFYDADIVEKVIGKLESEAALRRKAGGQP